MKTSTFVIRLYESADNAALTDIWYSASTIAHGFLGAEKLLEQRQLISDIYLPQGETWVACQNSQPIGFLGLMDNFVGGLFISPDIQGSGVGRALVSHALALKEVLNLDVYAQNERAVGFYQKLGFIELERRAEDKEGRPFEEISMRLSL